MDNFETTSPFIFYLTLDETLPKNFYTYDHHFKELGFILVPVKMDQLQTLVSASDQEQVVVIASVTDSREFKTYNDKVRGFLKFLLKSKRITFMLVSSYSKLSDQKPFHMMKNYYFLKYPVNVKTLSLKVAEFHLYKQDQSTYWPGGKRASVITGVS